MNVLSYGTLWQDAVQTLQYYIQTDICIVWSFLVEMDLNKWYCTDYITYPKPW